MPLKIQPFRKRKLLPEASPDDELDSKFGKLEIKSQPSSSDLGDEQSVYFNGKKVHAFEDPSNHIEKNFVFSDREVFLLEESSGGDGYPSMFQFMTIANTSVEFSDQFGDCSDIPEITRRRFV